VGVTCDEVSRSFVVPPICKTGVSTGTHLARHFIGRRLASLNRDGSPRQAATPTLDLSEDLMPSTAGLVGVEM